VIQNFKAWFLDSIYATRGFIQMYLYKNPPKKYLNHQANKNFPIIVLQGYMDRWGFIKNLADEISDAGFPVYIIPKLGNNLRDISDSAEIVNKLIERNKLKNVVIVGHSKGGLIGKYLLVNKNKENKILGLITISTPHVGSRMARYFSFLKSNEFQPENEIIQDLWSHHEVNKKIIAIFPKIDNVVWVGKRYKLDGAKDNIVLDSYGHHRILFDKKAQDKVIASINRFIQ
jgi:alpha-beta hydrolase superfamily lysophospholipase